MRLLLDSQAFVYVAHEPDALPAAARKAIEDGNNDVFLSIASPLELQIKINAKKIEFSRTLEDAVQLEISRGTFTLLPITMPHIDAMSHLPNHHRDPFDRLLIAQAIQEGLTLVTNDQQIKRHAAPTLWD